MGELSTAQIASSLKEMLPRYMLPNYIEALEQMPLTPNGKMNRVFLKEKYKQDSEIKKKK